jgi:hypothetical protein
VVTIPLGLWGRWQSRLRIERMIANRHRLDDVNTAMKRMQRYKEIKQPSSCSRSPVFGSLRSKQRRRKAMQGLQIQGEHLGSNR